MLKVGLKVFYENEMYTIIHRYSSGYCEIKDMESHYRVLLVHEMELVST
jgi:hypothetical protein